jgi:hypothetical protein
MDDLDRLGWATGFSFRAHGVRVGVRVNDPSIVPRVRELLPPGSTITDESVVEHLCSVRVAPPSQRKGVRGFHVAYSDIQRIGRSHDVEEILDAVEGDLRLFVAAFARRRLFVHAAVVGWKGRAILIPGRSRSGKSTLTEALVGAGATYYSDEYAVLDPNGRVHPFATPISRRTEGRPLRISIESPGTTPLPVGLVVATRYQARTKRFRPRAITPGQVTLELFSHTVAAQRLGGKAFGILKEVSLSATGVRGPRGDAQRAAEEILACLDRFWPNEQHTPRRLS